MIGMMDEEVTVQASSLPILHSVQVRWRTLARQWRDEDARKITVETGGRKQRMRDDESETGKSDQDVQGAGKAERRAAAKKWKGGRREGEAGGRQGRQGRQGRYERGKTVGRAREVLEDGGRAKWGHRSISLA